MANFLVGFGNNVAEKEGEIRQDLVGSSLNLGSLVFGGKAKIHCPWLALLYNEISPQFLPDV
jgi:hypothetical protein